MRDSPAKILEKKIVCGIIAQTIQISYLPYSIPELVLYS
jgi:hypothetical protein